MTPLAWSLCLLVQRPGGVVDRIEGELAVVEWPSGRFSDVPLACLDTHIQEGDRIERPRRRCRPHSFNPRSRKRDQPNRSRP